MRNNKGFTLIEMLVVIAVVGILSAAILTALGPSRNKAKDTRIISDVKQAQALGEVNYNATAGVYTVCSPNATSVSALATDATNQGGSLTINCNSGATSAGYSSTLNAGGSYCVDSTGKTGTTAASGGVCP